MSRSKTCPSTCNSLLLHVCRGSASEADRERFVLTYWPVIYYWCRQRGLSENDAEDLTQGVWERLVEKLPAFEYDGEGSFGGWLCTMTNNMIIDFFRSKKRRRCVGLLENDHVAARDLLEQLAWRDLLETAMKNVREVTRESDWKVFELAVLEELPFDEVAARLPLEKAEAYRAKYRVSEALRLELERLERLCSGERGPEGH